MPSNTHYTAPGLCTMFSSRPRFVAASVMLKVSREAPLKKPQRGFVTQPSGWLASGSCKPSPGKRPLYFVFQRRGSKKFFHSFPRR